MLLTVDDEIFSRQRRGGVSRYFAELLREFRDDPALDVQLAQPRFWTRNEHLLRSGFGRRVPARIPLDRRALMAGNRLAISARRPDVVHHTFYSRRYLRIRAKVRAVTIYDMIPELHPELFPSGNPHFDKREFVARADVVFCISESTSRDLATCYGPDLPPVLVTPLGVSSGFSPTAARPAGLPDRYILHVGARHGYKDFAVLVDAFAALAPGDPALHLVAAGGEPVSHDEQRRWQAPGLAGRVTRVDVPDRDLAGLYRHALCFVYPSRYEGFGLPTLEAMASGCPTVLARSSSHPEVGGDVACYFDPGDDEGLAATLTRLCSDEDLRLSLTARGIERAASFTWSRTARQTVAGYQSVL